MIVYMDFKKTKRNTYRRKNPAARFAERFDRFLQKHEIGIGIASIIMLVALFYIIMIAYGSTFPQ